MLQPPHSPLQPTRLTAASLEVESALRVSRAAERRTVRHTEEAVMRGSIVVLAAVCVLSACAAGPPAEAGLPGHTGGMREIPFSVATAAVRAALESEGLPLLRESEQGSVARFESVTRNGHPLIVTIEEWSGEHTHWLIAVEGTDDRGYAHAFHGVCMQQGAEILYETGTKQAAAADAADPCVGAPVVTYTEGQPRS